MWVVCTVAALSAGLIAGCLVLLPHELRAAPPGAAQTGDALEFGRLV